MNKYVKYSLIGAGSLTAIIIGAKIYKKLKAVKDTKDYSTTTTSGGQTVSVTETAKQIGLDLGTAYPSYDPRSWTENDDKVKLLLLKFPQKLIPKLSLEYAKIYSRSLPQDLQKNLDDWEDVKHLFTGISDNFLTRILKPMQAKKRPSKKIRRYDFAK